MIEALVRERGRWRLVARSESIEEVIAGDLAVIAAAGASSQEEAS